MKRMFVYAVVAFTVCARVSYAQAPGGWAVEFNDAGDIAGVDVGYYADAATEHRVPDRVKATVDEGCLHLDCDFRPGDLPGAGFIGYGTGWYWNTTKTRPFEPVDLVKYPFVQIRFRTRGPVSGFQIYYEVETHGGQTAGGYLSVGTSPGAFKTTTFRLNHESQSPQKWTPTKLLGIAPGLSVTSEPIGLDIDYLRVRGFTDAEMSAEKARAERLSRYKPPPVPKWATEEFVFGAWSTGPTNWWCGGLEGMFGDMARNHMNIIPREESDLTTDPAQIVVAARRAAKVADQFGIKIIRRQWYAGRRLNTGSSIGAIENYLQTITDGLKGVPGLVGWNTIDEPAAGHIWMTVGPKQILEEQDPNRIVVFPINGVRKAEIYLPYTTITISDRYPIHKATERDPWMIAKFCRDISLLSDRPHWFIPQTAGKTDPDKADPGDYLFPTAEEWRVMVYLAIANGVKGITMWETCSTVWGGIWDRVGNECAIMPTIKEVGERLVTVGPLLMKTQVELEPPLSIETDTKDPEHGLSVGVLYDPSRNVRYLVVVNESVTEAQAGKIVTKDETGDLLLYDLYALTPVPDFRVEQLAAGEGRIYLLADAKAFQADNKTIVANRVDETLRVMKPDLLIARRWNMDLSQVDSLIAERRANEARDLLEDTMAECKAYAQCKAALDGAAKDFGKAADKIYLGYFYTPNEGMERADTYLQMLATQFSFLRQRLIRGDSEGLLDDIAAYHARQTALLPK